MSTADEPAFEVNLAELERCVRALETGEVPLEEALRLFEQGVALARTCHEHLDVAEKRVATLSRGSRGVEERVVPEPDGDE
jgi:exodeoxyribonuclease VII small subunit